MPGDSIAVISQRHGVPAAAILAANDIADANHIRAGQILRIPAAVEFPQEPASVAARRPAQTPVAALAMAPARRIPDMSAPAYAPAPAPRLQPAAPRQALDREAERELLVSARATSLARPQLKPAIGPALAANTLRQGMTGMGGPLLLEKPRETASLSPSAPRPDGDLSSPAQPGDPASDFIWPVTGRIISSFGQTSKGLVNDGVNIAVEHGTPVRAAAAGVVIYAGNELAGFGNLLLVKHANGYVTAYAHNSKLLVRKGARVSQGQTIAEAGKTGDVDRPQVHFEIRKGDKPVDPRAYVGSANARL
jgi:murein DD-endopeptidase MepM/ murein hydrolase activator NlpD